MSSEPVHVLLIGSGGREHALAWALRKSFRTGKLFIAPGNPGTAELGTNIALDISDFDAVSEFIQEQGITLTVVGPEQPLVDGIADYLEARGCAVFGPSAAAAQLEGSKSFAKEIMQKYGIPTGEYRLFSMDGQNEAAEYIGDCTTWPLVIKADGLAAGKGVFICQDRTEAFNALDYIREDKALRSASDRIIIEEFLEGEEVSVFAVCDGETAQVIAHAQDHKRIGEEDTGLNTGGMGAYAPTPLLDHESLAEITRSIVNRTIEAMKKEGHPYKGVLYCGLMMTPDGPKVIEYNCRFGDPECQVILPALLTDINDLLLAVANGRLDTIKIETDPDVYYTCVVLASEGYPRSYPKGRVISGIPADTEHLLSFHCGTGMDEETGRLVTSGGRVLNIVGKGRTLRESITNAYRGVSSVQFEGMYYRRDIGAKGLKYL